MKRTHSDMTLSVLPKMSADDPRHFKSTLEGSYTLYVTKVTDISKPSEKPIEDIEEPEEEDVAQQNKLNRGNARMIQLHLKDLDNTEILALETEKIDKLTFLKPNSLINLAGPLEVRCRNIMLMNKNVVHTQPATKEETGLTETTKGASHAPVQASVSIPKAPDIVTLDEDWDEDDEEDCIVLD